MRKLDGSGPDCLKELNLCRTSGSATNHKPGPLTGERFCTECEPRQHAVWYHLQKSDWSLTFTDTDRKIRIGFWLLSDSYEEVTKYSAGETCRAQIWKKSRGRLRLGVSAAGTDQSSLVPPEDRMTRLCGFQQEVVLG